MDNKYNISIIIPHFNTYDLLEKLLMSIPDREDVQVIVVDDKSPQGVLPIQNFAKKNRRTNLEIIVNREINKGAGTCRNIGLLRATGKWLLFADADDYFLEDFYNIVSAYFESNADRIYFLPTSIDEDTQELGNRHQHFENLITAYLEGRETSLNIRYGWSGPWSNLIRRDVVTQNEIKFDETMVGNDVVFSTKCGYYCKRIEVKKEIIYCILRRYNTLTTKIGDTVFECRVNVFINQYLFLKKHLSNHEFTMLHISGFFLFAVAKEHKISIKKYVELFLKLIKNGIPIIAYANLNPFYLTRRLSMYRKERKLRKEAEKYLDKS